MARIDSYDNTGLVTSRTNGTQVGEPAAGVYDKTGTLLRTLTQAEAADLAGADAALTTGSNQRTLQSRAQAALTANATYLGIASPTAAQVAAQTARNTRTVSGVVRLLLGLLDDVSGT